MEHMGGRGPGQVVLVIKVNTAEINTTKVQSFTLKKNKLWICCKWRKPCPGVSCQWTTTTTTTFRSFAPIHQFAHLQIILLGVFPLESVACTLNVQFMFAFQCFLTAAAAQTYYIELDQLLCVRTCLHILTCIHN